MKIYTLLFATILLFITGCKDNVTYKPGQEWNYKTRKGEESSTLKILKIEEYPEYGKVIHISIGRLKMQNPHSKEGIAEQLSHIPISKKALDESITTLKNEEAQIPDYLDGYNYWKREFEKNQAGVFSVPVSEIISSMEHNLIIGDVIN